MRMLVQLQLSNYDTNGKFILEADSGWQMVMGRVREMLKLVPDMTIVILGPQLEQLLTDPREINPDLFESKRVSYRGVWIQPNALATRFNFDMLGVSQAIGLAKSPFHDERRYEWVYINDPMQLRNFKAMFNLYTNYQPKFAVHSHFIDNPSCPKFPTDASLWLGQVEASIRADINFWQCQSSLDIYKEEASAVCKEDVVEAVMSKSFPWDDGYSSTETWGPSNRAGKEEWEGEPEVWDTSKIRFDTKKFIEDTKGKTVLFMPNRIGGRGRSSDYTNCGKFMFEVLPELHKRTHGKFVLVAGNPSQKFSNKELEAEFGQYGYMNLVPDSFRREEYLWVGRHSHLSIGLYDQDSYGGTAARELCDLGCLPVWLDKYEYGQIARQWMKGEEPICLTPDLSVDNIIKTILQMTLFRWQNPAQSYHGWRALQNIVRNRCSYEKTTPIALAQMGILLPK